MDRHEQPVATSAESTQTALAGLPKVELHVHLEGSTSVDTVATLYDRHDVEYSSIWPDAGLRLCVNTDDPGWFATDLMTELSIVSELFGIDASLAPPSTKSSFESELAEFVSSR